MLPYYPHQTKKLELKMVEITYLPTETARFLNDARAAISVYKSRNSDRRYTSAIDKYTNLYKSGLKDLLVTDKELSAAA